MAIKVGQSLIEEEKDPLATTPLEGGAGTVAPLGPGGVIAAGGTEDQAKMAETPQAMQGLSKKVSQRAQDTLAGQKRLKKPKTDKQSPEEEAYAQRLSKLGSLGGSIQRLVDQEVEAAAAKDIKLEVDENFTKNMKPERAAKYTAGINGINNAMTSGGNVGQAMTALKESMRLDENGTPLSGQDLESLIKGIQRDVASTVAGHIASGVVDADDVNIGTLFDAGIMDVEDLGLTEEELSKDLGSNWINMTPKQLSAAVDRVNAVKYGESEQLQGMLNDPMVSSSQKEDIRDRLYEMGASGALATESRVDTLAKQVEASGMVEFAGEYRDLDDVLSDEGMEQTIGDYVDGDEAFRAKFEKENPQLAAFFDKNAEDLKGAIAEAEGSEQTINEIRDENRKVYTFGETGSKVEMTEETLSAMFPDYEKGQFTNKGIDSNNELFKYLKANPTESVALVETINALAEVDPDLVKEAMAEADGDPAKLRKLISKFQSGGKEMVRAAKITSGFEKLTPKSSVDDFVNLLFGEDADMDSGKLEEKMAAAAAAAPFDPEAKKTSEALKKIFDPDGDGIDTPEEIYERVKDARGGEAGLSDIMNDTTSMLEDIAASGSSELAPASRAQQLLGDAMKDGKINRTEITKMAKKASADDILMIYNSDVEMSKDTKRQLYVEGQKKAMADPLFSQTLESLDPGIENFDEAMRAPEVYFDTVGKSGGGSTTKREEEFGKIEEYTANTQAAYDAATNPFEKGLLRDKLNNVNSFWNRFNKYKELVESKKGQRN